MTLATEVREAEAREMLQREYVARAPEGADFLFDDWWLEHNVAPLAAITDALRQRDEALEALADLIRAGSTGAAVTAVECQECAIGQSAEWTRASEITGRAKP